jgi:hypothetical protein
MIGGKNKQIHHQILCDNRDHYINSTYVVLVKLLCTDQFT